MVHSLPQQEWGWGVVSPCSCWVRGPRRRTEDLLDTNSLKMALSLAKYRDPGL